jgi:hypothetical protein
MEAYKGAMPASIYASMAILAQHPKQVIVLKGTQAVCGLKGRAASSEQLIDVNQTREFPEYCRSLIAAQSGDRSFQKQLLEHGREAAAYMDRILADAGTVLSGFDAAERVYSDDELKIIRNGNKYTQKMADKIMHNFMLLAVHLFKEFKDQGTGEITTNPEVRNTFIFRYALCAYLSILKWISIGGTRSTTRKPERIRNDYIVDVNFAAFATYFDGLLTAEKKLQEIYATADFLLREILVMPEA